MGRSSIASGKATGIRISEVAETYRLHPQTLRLYERAGLLLPRRSRGNTRLYSRRDLRRLGLILELTRDRKINLAGVGAVLRLRDRVEELQREVARLGGEDCDADDTIE